MSPQRNPPEHRSHDTANTSCPEVTHPPPPKSSSGVITVTVPLISMPDSTSNHSPFRETSPPPYLAKSTFASLSRLPSQLQNSTLDGKEYAADPVACPTLEAQQQPLFSYSALKAEGRILHPLTRTDGQVGRLCNAAQDPSGTSSNVLGIALAAETPCKTSPDTKHSLDGTVITRNEPVPDYQHVVQENLDKARGRLAHFSRLSARIKGTDFTPASLTIHILRIKLSGLDHKDPIFESVTELLQVNPDLHHLLLSMTQKELQDLLQIYNAAKGELGNWTAAAGFPAFLKVEDQRPYPIWKKQGDAEYFAGWTDPTIVAYTSPSISRERGARVYHDLITAAFAGRIAWCNLQRVLGDWDLYPKMQYSERLAWLEALIILCVIRPPHPSRRPPALNVVSAAISRSHPTICVSPALSRAHSVTENGTESKGNMEPGMPAAGVLRKGKAKVVRLAEMQSSRSATSSLMKNASPATASSATASSSATDVHGTLDTTQQILLDNALGLHISPLPLKHLISPQSNPQVLTNGKQGGSRVRGKKDESLSLLDDRSLVPSTVRDGSSSASASVSCPTRQDPESECKPGPSRQTQGKASGKTYSAPQLKLVKEVLANGGSVPAPKVALPVRSSADKPLRRKKSKVLLPREHQQKNGSAGQEVERASGPLSAIVVQDASLSGISTTQLMTPTWPSDEGNNALNAAQLKHSVGLRLSCSDPELGELEIIGAGFRDCFPHLQLCDHDPRYTYLWQHQLLDTISSDSTHIQDNTIVTSTTWDDLEIQISDNPISDSFLQNIRAKSSPILFEDGAGSSSVGSASATMTVFGSVHGTTRHPSSLQSESPPGTETFKIRPGGANTEISSSSPVSNGLNPYAFVYMPALHSLPVEEGAFDDAVESEPSMTPPPDWNQASLFFPPIASQAVSSPTALLSPPTDHVRHIGRQRKWRNGKGPRGMSIRAPPPATAGSTRGGTEKPIYVWQPSPSPWSGSWD
ncbi:hypothetical protein QFC21_005579 [Naganishia friedmannii]|uniref:Uncharacterized protein n=1 Tax=Naganishia friedmannii TaxID=89922 RepID=A0ACC2V8U5_9TREE|nr:hypothetical protein QFC21_005579 [Naganishia friedmannii]